MKEPAGIARYNSPQGLQMTLLRRVLVLLAVAILIRKWIGMPTIISGNSMAPTLHSGQVCGINKLAYLSRRPRRGDIVVVNAGRELAVKRVVALPGEEISVSEGMVYVNGSPLNEPYASRDIFTTIKAGRLAEGQFLVAGDNRFDSFTAVVNRERIIGAAGNSEIASSVAALSALAEVLHCKSTTRRDRVEVLR